MTYKAYVYIRKAFTGYEMRYGVYNTFTEAAEVVRLIKSVNPKEEVFIEEKYERE